MTTQPLSVHLEAARGRLEEGTAFAMGRVADVRRNQVSVPRPGLPESVKVAVIGGGQAGLSVGYHLKRRGIPFVILDGEARVGDAWRRRWDSLRLFTSAAFDGLDGMRFPAASTAFPTKDEMADYLATYAERFDLPVLSGHRVGRLARDAGGFLIEAGGRRLRAEQVVVAMSNYQRAKVPDFASDLSPEIVQLHSLDYRSPSQLRAGDVLIVGAGNSGAEIAKDLAATRRVHLSGRDTGEIPFDAHHGGLGQRVLAPILLRVIFKHVLSTGTPIGRKVRPKTLSVGGPLIRVKSKDLAVLGVERVARTIGADDGLPVLDGGQTLAVANVIWCTGFDCGFDWIDLPVPFDHGKPVQVRGVVAEVPGLYFIGQHFLYALSSAMIQGAGRDARYIVKRIAAYGA